jgi:hypothetical protein
MLAGSPRRSNNERLITEPPPDRVLINPTKIPAMMITTISVKDILTSVLKGDA